MTSTNDLRAFLRDHVSVVHVGDRRCPHCRGDHDGCTVASPLCSAAVADAAVMMRKEGAS